MSMIYNAELLMNLILECIYPGEHSCIVLKKPQIRMILMNMIYIYLF